MPIGFNCPKCGQRFEVADDKAGAAAKCPCGELMRVPIVSQPARKRPKAPPLIGSAFSSSPPPPPPLDPRPPTPEPERELPSPIASASVQSRTIDERKRRNLSTYCGYLRALGNLVLGLAGLGAVVFTLGGLSSVFALRSGAERLGVEVDAFTGLPQLGLALLASGAAVLVGFTVRVFYFAIAEFLEVIMDIEENTRPQ